jgi:hypothetical protein
VTATQVPSRSATPPPALPARWSPEEIGEVDAHSDGRTLTVAVRVTVHGRSSVAAQEFECGRFDDCVRALRAWLHTLALRQAVESDARVRAWADGEARRVLASLD